MNEYLRTRVLRFRGQHRMSQKALAKACGVHENTIIKFEAGGHIRPVTELKIIDFLEANNG